MRRVILESPYAGDIERNISYARACMRDCFLRGEAPIASHLLYTQPGILDDNKKEERDLGINVGLTWGCLADVSVVYTDFGISTGMKYGIRIAEKDGRAIEYRRLIQGGPRIISLSGSSGAGKSTVAKFLMRVLPDVSFIPSYTTRAQEERDFPGEYVYVSGEEFLKFMKQNVFAWHIEVHGNIYGTKIEDIKKAGSNNEGFNILMIVPDTVQSLRKWTKELKIKDPISFYIHCDNKTRLRKRLINRGEKEVDKRLKDCHFWDIEAVKYAFLIWINNGNGLKSTFSKVIRVLKQFGINAVKFA